MIDRDEITSLIERADPFGRERELTQFRLEKAQALALVRIGDLLEKLAVIREAELSEYYGDPTIPPPAFKIGP